MLTGIFFFLRDMLAGANILLICRYFLSLELRKRRAAAAVCVCLFAVNAALASYAAMRPGLADYIEIITDITSFALYIAVFFIFVRCSQRRRTLLFLACYVFVADMLYGVAARYIGDNLQTRLYFQSALFFIIAVVIIAAVKLNKTPKFPDIISITPRWIFISIMIFCLACYYRQFGVSSAWYETIYLTSVFLMLMSIGFFIFNMIRATQEINTLYRRMNEISQYYMRLAKNDEELRAFRHDYKNHMNVVSQLIDRGDVAEASKYIGELSLAGGKCFKKYSTGNEILDMILSNKSQTAETRGFALTFSGFFPPQGIEPADICTVCANLIDNAIEHGCTEPAGNEIRVESVFDNNCVILTVKNRAAPGAGDGLGTTKQDKVNHGFGIKNVRKTVKKYGGMMSVSRENESFCVRVMLKTDGGNGT